MNTFKIEDSSFNLKQADITDNFIVSSVPTSYEVNFETCDISETVNNLLDDDDILLIDQNVLELIWDKLSFNRDRIFVLEATENTKTIESVLLAIDFLHRCKFTKGEKMVVVGGGITQDIGSFVGSIYKRGINWKFVPTTLLSQCDSCIGGKTGINYKKSKNQLALFSSPSEVIINTNFLHTLEPQEIKSGLGEIMKIFIIGGRPFIELYQQLVDGNEVRNFDDFKTLIVNGLHIKRVIVEKDEFELDTRRSLNYGHTVGHAIESLTKYEIPHGQAVAIGIKIVNDLFGFSDPSVDKCVCDLIEEKDREALSKIDFTQLGGVLRSDKKTIGNSATFIYIDSLGHTKFQRKELNDEILLKIQQTINGIINE
jgi:3-dehydroquinate synthase